MNGFPKIRILFNRTISKLRQFNSFTLLNRTSIITTFEYNRAFDSHGFKSFQTCPYVLSTMSIVAAAQAQSQSDSANMDAPSLEPLQRLSPDIETSDIDLDFELDADDLTVIQEEKEPPLKKQKASATTTVITKRKKK
eukprot:78378_1